MDAAFHAERQTGIFATDLAPILRLCRFGRGPLDVAVDKLVGARDHPTESKRQGKRWEPLLAAFYEEETGINLFPALTYRHKEHGWAGCHPDFETHPGLSANPDKWQEDFLVDCKWTTQRKGWGEPLTDEVPPDIVIQMGWQMFCSGVSKVEIAALVCGEFRRYVIPRNDTLNEMLFEVAHDFWEMIKRGETPAPDWEYAGTPDLVKQLYRPDPKVTVSLGAEAFSLACQIAECSQARRVTEKEEELAKARLTVLMGNAAVGLLPDGEREVRRTTITVRHKAKEACVTEQTRLTVCQRKKPTN